MPERLTRPEWNALGKQALGEEAEVSIEARIGHAAAHVEFRNDEGILSDPSIYVGARATDIRIGDLQFLVGVGRLVVLRRHPPYPIQEWSVLYDGNLNGPADA